MHKLSFLAFWLFIIMGSGCTGSFNESLNYKPTALGETNEIAIIADKDWWDNGLQDSIIKYLASPYIITPQPEPILKVRYFTAEEINNEVLKRGLRMYFVIANLQDTASLTTKLVKDHIKAEHINRSASSDKLNNLILKDIWAQDQRIIYSFSPDKKTFYTNLRMQYPAIINAIYKHDEKKIAATTYVTGKNPKITRQIDSTLNLKIDIPEGYFIAVREKDFVWIRNETKDVSTNIMIKRIPYRNQDQLSQAGMKLIRTELGKYVTTDTDGSYMAIDELNFPLFLYKKNIDNKYALELRGVWQMEKDFMGGPFISYAILDESTQMIIFIDTFVFAPGKAKRNLMQQLECIVSSLKIGI